MRSQPNPGQSPDDRTRSTCSLAIAAADAHKLHGRAWLERVQKA